MKTRIVSVMFMAAMLVAGCGGGSGGDVNSAGGVAVTAAEYKMTNVQAPAGAGADGGFNYAALQTVTVDIALPYPGGTVSIYEARPVRSLYDAANNAAITAGLSVEQIANGLSSVTADSSGRYHYIETIMVPAATASVYVEPMVGVCPSSFSVPIIHRAATYTFTKGGVR